MTEADLAEVHALETRLFPEDAWSLGMLQDELADQPRTRHYVVAELGGEIVGYAGLAAAADQADVQTIGVRADVREAGIGTLLLTDLVEEAGRRGADEVFLEVRAGNDPAIRLYERFGFERVGLRKRYYQPSGTDAIVMRRRRAPRAAGFGFTGGNSQ
ncbi:ribosomal protein S18-alanine N-acetyltransferase [Actinomadura sp. PM05-2]|uniref:Ribosomal protein S18-alanine N-acetyltransferase n=2 Tax=Actinomadura parmotrematis TaxID=2864039 RepID=A0ABS7G4F9_9ACTN|nr:ribosomal protein S18-alanine N-acetyltransferase [Actinomadura parmotrematis]MBW8487426.1 ribosomal protein S18-alanine N-acetyltransferase [Actinomadura parmotrematis]